MELVVERRTDMQAEQSDQRGGTGGVRRHWSEAPKVRQRPRRA